MNAADQIGGALRELAREVKQLRRDHRRRVRVRQGVVVLQVGDTVAVQVGGSAVQAWRLAHYPALAPGDTVMLLQQDGVWVVLGKVGPHT